MNERFRTRYASRPKTGPENYEGHVSKVNTSAFVPFAKLVNSYILAGKNLQNFRENQFDIVDGDPDQLEPDITREGDFEEGDAQIILNEFEAKKLDALMKKREKELQNQERINKEAEGQKKVENELKNKENVEKQD